MFYKGRAKYKARFVDAALALISGFLMSSQDDLLHWIAEHNSAGWNKYATQAVEGAFFSMESYRYLTKQIKTLIKKLKNLNHLKNSSLKTCIDVDHMI